MKRFLTFFNRSNTENSHDTEKKESVPLKEFINHDGYTTFSSNQFNSYNNMLLALNQENVNIGYKALIEEIHQHCGEDESKLTEIFNTDYFSIQDRKDDEFLARFFVLLRQKNENTASIFANVKDLRSQFDDDGYYYLTEANPSSLGI